MCFTSTYANLAVNCIRGYDLQHHAQDFGPGGSGHAVAWAFLRLQGLRQQQLLGHPLQLQLQLYRYKPGGCTYVFRVVTWANCRDWPHDIAGKDTGFGSATEMGAATRLVDISSCRALTENLSACEDRHKAGAAPRACTG
jgi:hypothetical protein